MDSDRERGAGRSGGPDRTEAGASAVMSVSGPLAGAVTEMLPSSLYRVRLDEGSSVTAHVCWYVTAATYQGVTRYGREATAGHLSGRDPGLLPICAAATAR